MFYKLSKLTVFIFLSFLYVNKSFSGSDLFCVNQNNTWDAKWLKLSQGDGKYELGESYHGYYWLKGSLYIVNDTDINLHDGLKLEKNNYQNAQSVCNSFISTCQKNFGNDYRYVGVAGYSLAATDWGYIIVDDFICPNWNTPNGHHIKNQQSVGNLIADIGIGVATSGPTPNRYPFTPPKAAIIDPLATVSLSSPRSTSSIELSPLSSGGISVETPSASSLGSLENLSSLNKETSISQPSINPEGSGEHLKIIGSDSESQSSLLSNKSPSTSSGLAVSLLKNKIKIVRTIPDTYLYRIESRSPAEIIQEGGFSAGKNNRIPSDFFPGLEPYEGKAFSTASYTKDTKPEFIIDQIYRKSGSLV
ncbi:hypothetical protein [Silvanigrella sp.]|jgi:hypothetical protein|uniref:hypothetical protein n=1 Tax=Silvanigrella sp. TaxID=2024976 RepID=UPI0037CBC73B